MDLTGGNIWNITNPTPQISSIGGNNELVILHVIV